MIGKYSDKTFREIVVYVAGEQRCKCSCALSIGTVNCVFQVM